MKAESRVSVTISAATEGDASIAKLSKGIGQVADSAEKVTPQVQGLAGAFANLSNVAGRYAQVAARLVAPGAAAGVAAIAVGAVAMARSVAASAKEISNLSAVSNTSVTQFQRYAHAAGTVGVAQDKLADILKDVGDKTGEFLQTGGGPMKDFFEKIGPLVGVTAEQFRNLSGPQALQLYFDSLQKANLSQAEMTFYLEALASDATLLLPLLRNNGQAFRELGDEAERLGKVIGEEVIAKGREFSDNLERLEALAGGVKIAIGNELIPTLNRLTGEFLNARLAGLSFLEALVGIGLTDPGKSPAEQIARITAEINNLKNGGFTDKSLFENIAPEASLIQLEKQLKYFQLELTRDAATSQQAISGLKEELAGVGAEIQRFEGLQSDRGGYLNAFDKASLARLREQATGIRERIAVLQGVLDVELPDAGNSGAQQAQQQLQLEREITTERERLMNHLAVKHGVASNTILLQGAARHKAEVARAKELANEYQKAYATAVQAAKNAAKEASALLNQAGTAEKDRNRQAEDLRDQKLSPEDLDSKNERRARELTAEANRQSVFAQNAAIDGRDDKARSYAEESLAIAKEAGEFAAKLSDKDMAANFITQIGQIEKAGLATQAKLKQNESAQFDQEAQAQLALLQTQLTEINRLSMIEVDANVDQAITKIALLTQTLKELPDSKTVTVNVVTQGAIGGDAAPLGDLPAKAYGGPLPGTATGDRSDNVVYRGTPGEWVIQRPAVRAWGVDNMRRINRGLMPRFAYGGELGAPPPSLTQNVKIPRVDANAGRPAAGTPIVIQWPDGSTAQVMAEQSVADQIVKTFRRAALARGGRR